jgi:multiple sugar transport system ATP-binding protein
MTRPKLELVGLSKEFSDGSVAAVDGVDLAVASGETVALLGPSGCGKSTTLNMIVGLEQPTGGDILIDGRSVVAVPPGKRNIGLVFQDYAVFTHMTVAQNLAFGLEVRGRPKHEITRAVGEVAEMLGMADRLKARARDLGGSELQRVAIGRTLVTRPAILLLDEPLSNLEAAARLAMRRELRRLQKEIGLTIVYVTHDQVEALSLADRIAVMSVGKIRQVAATADIYDRPDHVFVAGFLGSPPMNLLRGRLSGEAETRVFQRDRFRLDVAAVPGAQKRDAGAEVVLGVRPEAMRLTAAAAAAAFVGRAVLVEPRGPQAVVTVEAARVLVKVLAPTHDCPPEGAEVGIAIDPGNLVLFSGETGRRLVA